MMNWCAGLRLLSAGDSVLPTGAIAGNGMVGYDQYLYAGRMRAPGKHEVLTQTPVGVELSVEFQQVAALAKIESQCRGRMCLPEKWGQA